METPNVIYLIDTGDEISWCDYPNPSGYIDIDDTIKYVKSSVSDALLDALEEYMRANKALSDCGYDDPIKLRAARDDFFDAEKDAKAAIAAARGDL